MPLQAYLQELKKIQLLSREEEAALWHSYKSEQDLASRSRLIEQYQPLVFKAASQWQLGQTMLMDVLQEGTVGLIEAVEHYDYQRGVAFSLYAWHRIRGRMLNYLAREGKQALASLDVANDEDSVTLAESLADTAPAIITQVEDGILMEKIKQAMGKLPVKEQAVLHGVFWEDQEAKQLADTLNISLSHLYRLQKQGVRRIRGMLAKFMQHW